jgi:hypothetical protein
MKRWIRIIVLALAVGLVVVLAVVLAGTWMYHGTPSWYHARSLTPEQSRAAANRADQKFADLISWVASVQAQNVRRQLGTSEPADRADPPSPSKTITFSEDELNAFYQAWDNPDKSHMQAAVAPFFSQGRLVLMDDSIILAGKSPDFGTVASAQFDPMIDSDGKLWLRFAGIQAGRLPLPRSVVADKLDRLNTYLKGRLAFYQQTANVDPTLTANGSAVVAGMTRLLLDALNDGPSEPILFVPFDLSNLHRAMPVKLSGVKISRGQIALTVQPLSESDQPTVENLIEKPYQQ